MAITVTRAGMPSAGKNRSFLEVMEADKGQSFIRLTRVNHSKGWGAKPLV